jgi:TonB-dependent SusC/RagA subfamily outer membrane receptor
LVAVIPATRICPRTRRDLLLALVLTAVLAACEASMPTAEDVKKMDVALLERSAQAVGVGDLVKADYFVNGTPVTADAARAIAPEEIAAVRVMNTLIRNDGAPGNGSGPTQVRIVTKDATDATDRADMEALRADVQAPAREQRAVVGTQENGASVGPAEGRQQMPAGSSPGTADPLVFIDHAQTDFAAMKMLSPDRIESLSVLKNAIAVKEYGARGANGVIMITTKQ